jgi:hypothetical protein
MKELKDVIKDLPTITTVDPTTDLLVLVDMSGDAVGKATPSHLGISGGGGGGGVTTLANTYSNDLALAIDSIGSTPTTLIIDADTTFTVHRDVPTTLKFEQRNGAKINLTGIASLKFLGNPIGGYETAFFAVNPAPSFLWPNLGQMNFTLNTLNYTNHGFQTGQQFIYTLFQYGDADGLPPVSMNGMVDNTVYYAIRIDANTMQFATTHAQAMASTTDPAANNAAGRAIDVSLGSAYNTFLIHHCPLYWSGTDSPWTVSSELVDTGNNSESTRANVLTRALTGHGCWINIYPRQIDESVFLANGHNIRLMKGNGSGIHQNIHDGTSGSQNHWPYSPFSMQFAISSDSEFTSERGAICQQSNVDYINGIVAIRIRARNSVIHHNHFRQDRQETATGSASPISINGGVNNHILDNYAEKLKCYVFSINPSKPGVSDPFQCSCMRNTVKDTLTQVFFIGGGDEIDFSYNTMDVKDHILFISTTRIATGTNIVGVPNGTLTATNNLNWVYTSSGDPSRRITTVGGNDSYSTGYQAITLNGVTTLSNTQAATFDNLVACSPFDIEPNGITVLKNIRIEGNTFDTRGLNNGGGSIISFIRVNPAGVTDPQNIFINNNRFILTYPTEAPMDGRYLAIDINGVDNFEVSGNVGEGVANAFYAIMARNSRRGRIFNNTFKNGASGVLLYNSQDTEVFENKYLPTPDMHYGTTTIGNVTERPFFDAFLRATSQQYYLGTYLSANTVAFAPGTPGFGIEGGYVFKHFLQSKVYINDLPYTITGINNVDFVTYPTTQITVSPNFSSTPTIHLLIANTDINTTTNVLHAVGHGYLTGAGIYYNTGTMTEPTGALFGSYFVIRVDADNFKLAHTYEDVLANNPIDLVSVPVGSHEFYTSAVAFPTGNDFHDNSNGLQLRLITPHSTTLVRKGSVDIKPSIVGSLSASSQTFTLLGARVGDALTLNPSSAGLTDGLFVEHAFVSADDTITIVFYNTTGSPIDQDLTTWTYTLDR